ncbi:MAG: hypothetical protein QNJ36_18600 [Calothrix sp. MO_167.B42]|nr:hypothetical protein [Calothrix sp. MO_167.B42]
MLNKKSIEEELDKFLKLPPAVNKHLAMRYFIPEWDDKVDASYDFIRDEFSANRNAYTDDIYAHQIYGQGNYDGILVSKVIVDKKKVKEPI